MFTGVPPKRGVAKVVSSAQETEQGYEYEVEEDVLVEEEEDMPLDLEESKKQLRRMSLQMNEALSPAARKSLVASLGSIKGLQDLTLDDAATGAESDEESVIEEIVDDDDDDEVEEEVVEDDTEVVEETEHDDVLEEIVEEGAEEDEEEQEEEEEIEEDEDEEEEDDEEDEEEEDATEAEVKEAIVYILKQERPIDNGHLTPEQATKMMALPFPAMKEIMKHFELCDNAGEPIQWKLIREIVTDDGDGGDDDDDDDDECDNGCVHGYGYCVECGVTDNPENADNSDDEDRDEVGSLGSGFELNPSDVVSHGQASYNDLSDSIGDFDATDRRR